MRPFFKVRDFSKNSISLWNEFERIFIDPRKGTPNRFKWDPWFVKDKYALLRSPAEFFFGESKISALKNDLRVWGQKNLLCQDLSPLWLSLYTEGHFQNVHADHPHGPWAFVLPLNSRPSFSGGDTFIRKPDFLHEMREKNYFEHENFEWLVRPKFNELIVFDPSFPHGVTRVGGTQNPLEGRLVLHGWFQSPEIILQPRKNCVLRASIRRAGEEWIMNFLQFFGGQILEGDRIHGFLAIEFELFNHPIKPFASRIIVNSTCKPNSYFSAALRTALEQNPPQSWIQNYRAIRIPVILR